MKKTITRTGVLAVALLVIAAFTMLAIAPPSYAQGNGNGKGKAYGHFIAPGWLKKNEAPSSEGVSLPPGIAKKLDPGEEEEDTTAPVISNIDVDTTNTVADITWNTNEPARSVVYVSTSSPVDHDASGTMSETDTDLETLHEASFDALEASTTYYAIIVVTDDSGNTSTSTEFSFVTDETEDTTAPVITNIVVNPDHDSALFTWDTNESANSEVYLSTTSPVNVGDPETMSSTSASLVTHHSITLSNLEASTTYFALVVSGDASDNTSTSSLSFTTDEAPDMEDPLITDIVVVAGTSTADVSWSTDELATSVVYASTTDGFSTAGPGVMVVSDMTLVADHTLELTGLTASTTYYIRVQSVDASANAALSNQVEFTTSS